MSYKASPELAESILAGPGVKPSLDDGFIFIFAGPVPATAQEALDMVSDHTQLAKLSESDDGVTGLTFDAPTGAVLPKADAETWQGTVNIDGADVATTQTPTFFRFCQPGDTGRGVGTTPRLQGSVGGPSSLADLKLGSATLTDNGTNKTGADSFNVRISSLV